MGLEFMREVSARHILNIGVENNINRCIRWIFKKMKESRESLDRKKKEPFILDGICLKQKEKTLNR